MNIELERSNYELFKQKSVAEPIVTIQIKPELFIPKISKYEKQILEFKAHAIPCTEIADIFNVSRSVIKNDFKRILKKTGTTNETAAITNLVNLGELSLDSLEDKFEYDNYKILSKRMRELLLQASQPDAWNKNIPTMAKDMGIAPQTLKNNLSWIYGDLGVLNLLQARLFMFYLPDYKLLSLAS